MKDYKTKKKESYLSKNLEKRINQLKCLRNFRNKSREEIKEILIKNYGENYFLKKLQRNLKK